MVQMGDWLSFHSFANMITSNRSFRIEENLFFLITNALLTKSNVLHVLMFQVK